MQVAHKTLNRCRVLQFPSVSIGLNKLNKKPEVLVVPDHNGILICQFDEILYAQADGNYTKLHLTCGKVETISWSLKKLEQLLPELHFTRVHKSFVVAITTIRRIGKDRITLINEKEVPISRRRRKEVVGLFRSE